MYETAEDRNTKHTLDEVIDGVRECIFHYRAKFKRPPVMKEVSDRLWERHRLSLTAARLHALVLNNNKKMFEIATNGGFAVGSGRKPEWYLRLSEKDKMKIVIITGRRDDAPVDDEICKSIVSNGVVIHNPINQLLGETTRKNVNAIIGDITALRRQSVKPPRKSGRIAHDAMICLVGEAVASQMEKTAMMLDRNNMRQQMQEDINQISKKLSGKKK
jgi:hypothetical protein